MLTQIAYREITRDGVVIQQGEEERLIPADTVVIAAGATPNDQLFHELNGRLPVHLIGGAKEAGELDAKRAIWEGSAIGRVI